MNLKTIKAIAYDMLDEVYIGRKGLKEAEKICIDIVNKINDNRNINMEREPESDLLESAIKKVFGFKRVEIYWAHHATGGMGPHTYIGSRIIHSGSRSFITGTKHSDGFYDKNHELTVIVVMEQEYVATCNLTGQELLAVILHEIGHNFDYSADTMFVEWYNLFSSILSDFGLTAIINNGVREYGRDVIMTLRNLDDKICKAIPPLDSIRHTLGPLYNKFIALINSLLSPTIFITAPAAFLMTPITYLLNYFTRKGEEYSDSFAATYGYATELATGLDKLDRLSVMGGSDIDKMPPMLSLFYDMSLCNIEIVRFCTGGHGTTQTRTIKMIDKLQQDINKSTYSPSTKAELQKDLDNLRQTYNKLINMNDSDRLRITAAFRQMIDNWFDGKDYIVIPHNRNYTE